MSSSSNLPPNATTPPSANAGWSSPSAEVLRGKVPPREATLTGPVSAPVTIRWDTWGIPHIRGRTRADLCFGLGYATAQEHLWRLEYCRRQARGQLAAILGRSALASDRTMRLLGIGRNADQTWQREPEVVVESLAALTAGINQWIEQAIERRVLPVEFDWLGYEPAPWTPADSIASWKARWWMLTGRLENITLVEAARRHLPPELLDAFLAVELGEEAILPASRAGDASEVGPDTRATPASLPSGGTDTGEGSNNWTVSGALTTTGYPVLCSDPHNPFSQPSQWFEAQLTLEDGSLDVAGAVYISVPAVYFGRNRHVAWGFTNHVAPIRDLYVETTDLAEPDRYREGDEWRPFEINQESVEVRGETAERLEVRRTIRGPVVNAILPKLRDDEPPISLRWSGTEVGSGLEALLGLNAASSAQASIEAMAHWPAPIANLLVADTSAGGGHIAYHAVGWVPRRSEAKRGYRQGTEPKDAWEGFLPYDSLPHGENPSRGWFATANQPPWREDPPEISYLAGAAWADGGRMRRIRTRIENATANGGKLSPRELGAIQGDITSQRAAELLPALLRVLGGDASAPSTPPLVHEAITLLGDWDARFVEDAAAPTVWTAFWDHWLRRVAGARFPAELVGLTHGQVGAVARMLLLDEDTSPSWFQGRPIQSEVIAAFAEALSWLVARFGAEPANWAWGKHHTVTWSHALADHGDRRQAAAELFNVGPFSTTGGNTVRAAGYGMSRPYHVTGGATYRLVADLSPGGGLWSVSTTGQSGHPASVHYANQAPLWLADEYHPFPMDDFEAEGVTKIVPARE
jgi:penicillin G amidase